MDVFVSWHLLLRTFNDLQMTEQKTNISTGSWQNVPGLVFC